MIYTQLWYCEHARESKTYPVTGFYPVKNNFIRSEFSVEFSQNNLQMCGISGDKSAVKTDPTVKFSNIL